MRIEKVIEITRSLVHSKSHVPEIKWSPCWGTHDLALFSEILVTPSPRSLSPLGRFTSFHSLNLPISPCGAFSNQVLHQQGGWWDSSCLTCVIQIALHRPVWSRFAFESVLPLRPFHLDFPFSFYLCLPFTLTPRNTSLMQNDFSHSYILSIVCVCGWEWHSLQVILSRVSVGVQKPVFSGRLCLLKHLRLVGKLLNNTV